MAAGIEFESGCVMQNGMQEHRKREGTVQPLHQAEWSRAVRPKHGATKCSPEPGISRLKPGLY